MDQIQVSHISDNEWSTGAVVRALCVCVSILPLTLDEDGPPLREVPELMEKSKVTFLENGIVGISEITSQQTAF